MQLLGFYIFISLLIFHNENTPTGKYRDMIDGKLTSTPYVRKSEKYIYDS